MTKIKLNKGERVSKVYVNGLLQRQGKNDDYIVEKSNVNLLTDACKGGSRLVTLETIRDIQI